MKLLFLALACALFVATSSFAGPILNNNDIVTASTLEYDLDGLELWTIPQEERAQTTEQFTNKCLQTIPNLFKERLGILRMNLQDFSYNTSIISKKFPRHGTQIVCRTKVKILSPNVYKFKFDYSKIISERPYETCKAMVEELDTQVEQLSLFDRRVYFQIKTVRNNQLSYEKCQVLAIKLATK